MKFTKLPASFLSLFTFLFVFAGTGRAVYLNSGSVLDLPKDKTFAETVIVGASTLTVDSTIDGDLICAGESVVVNGDIRGDILCAAESIKINGNVDGSVRVAARNIEVSGVVKRNVTSLSQNLTLTKFSTVGGDIFFAGQLVDLRGSLGRDLLGAGEQISFTGTLGRDASMTASRIAFTDPALVGGNFEYFVDSESVVTVDPRNVKGKIVPHKLVAQTPNAVEPVRNTFNFAGKFFMMLAYFLLGLALIYFLKKGVEDRTGFITKKPFVTGLVGFAALILTPLAVIILMVTVIGIPLAVILLLEYIMSLIMASLYPSIVLGNWLVKNLLKKKNPKTILSLLFGIIAVGVITSLPAIGVIIGFTLVCLGLGSIFISYLPAK